MSDSEHTRFVRLRADSDRGGARNEGTYCATTREFEQVVLVDHHTLFNHHQRRLHQILREHPKPGVVVFGLHWRNGLAGHLWLEATDQLRAGTLGRHSEVDLFLPDDSELSLRHLLVLVKASPRGQRIRVLDLATPAGFQAEQGGVLRAVDANGTLILRAAGYSLFLFPTGAAPPWDSSAADPWLTLPSRVLVADERPARRSRWARQERRGGTTDIAFREGPSEAGPAPVLQDGESVEGHLVLSVGGVQANLPVGGRALDRGIILGRYSRCTGETGAMSKDVSRVHAMLLRVEGSLHIVDTGSTNGVLKGNAEVKCQPVEPCCGYLLGGMQIRWEPVQ